MKWQELTDLFTDGDPEITIAAERAYRDHPDAALQMGIDKELYQFIRQAMPVK